MHNDRERQLLRETMENAGYTVLEARSSLQALEISHKNPGLIHLLIADLGLPRMSGRQLSESLQMERPALRSLFVTLLGPDEIARHQVSPEQVCRLDGPFQRPALLRKIREALTAGSTRR